MENKNLMNVADYNKTRSVLKNILVAAKRELALKDYRDVTFVLSAESFIHFVISDRIKGSHFRFDKDTLPELCEKIAQLYPDLGKEFSRENIEIVTKALQSFREMTAKVRNKEASKVWLTYHEVFGYYVFDNTECILKFTHEMFYKYCQQNSIVQ